MIRWWRRRRAKTLLRQALNAAQREDYDRAIHIASAALLVDNAAAEGYQQRGMWYHLAQRDGEALQDYAQAIRRAPDEGQLYIERASILAETGDHAAAIADYDTALGLQPNNASAYQARARSHLALDALTNALADLSSAIQHAPNNAMLYKQRAEIRAIGGKVGDALDDYDRAVELMQNANAQAQLLLTAMDARADTQSRALGAALQDELNAIRVQRGQLRLLQGNIAGAGEDFEAVLTVQPQHSAALNGRGMVRSRQNDIEAINDFQQVLKLEPRRYATYVNLGEFYFQLNQFERAHSLFQRLEQLEPGHVIAQMGLALSEHAMKHKRDAYARWKALIAHDAHFQDIKWLERDIFAHHPRLLKEAGNLILRLV